jgi:hypothetical protein
MMHRDAKSCPERHGRILGWVQAANLLINVARLMVELLL